MKPLPVSPHALRQIYSSSDGILMTLILVAFVFPPLQISFVHPSLLGLPKEPLERDRFQTTRSKLMHLKPACFVLQTPVAYCLFWLTFTRRWAREANWTPLNQEGRIGRSIRCKQSSTRVCWLVQSLERLFMQPCRKLPWGTASGRQRVQISMRGM